MKTARPALLWAGGVLATVLVAVALCEASGWPFLRLPMQKALTRASGVPVALDGAFRTHLLWGQDLAVAHIRIGAAGGVAVPYLMDARDLRLAWRWGDIWRWRQGQPLRVQSLVASALDAHLVRGADGRASWQLGQQADPSQDRPDSDPLASLPQVGLLQVGEGHIEVDDPLLRTQLKIDLRGGREGDALDGAPAGWQATVAGRWRELPLKLQVRTGAVLPLLQNDLADAELPMVAARIEGQAGAARLLFDGKAGALMGERRLQGALRFSGPSLARVGEPLGLTLPHTAPFQLSGELGHTGSVWHLRADRAVIGRSLLKGDFHYDTSTQPPRLSGQLNGSRLALADLGPAVGKSVAPTTEAVRTAAAPAPVLGAAKATAPSAAASSATNGRKVLPRQPLDLPSLRAMDADVQVAIDELDFGSTAINALRQLQTHVLLQAGVLQLQALKAQVAGGQFSGSTQIDANADPARWSADLRFAAVDIAGWLPGVRATPGAAAPVRTTSALKNQRERAREGGAQPVNAYVTGTLSGGVKAAGHGRSTGEVLSTLNGQADVTLRDGTLSHLITELAGLDIAQALGVLIRSDRPLPLRCARLDLAIHDGIVQPRSAVLDNADSTIRITGQIDLGSETMALRAVTRPKDFSPLTLRSPITVGGSLGNPVVGIEGKPLAIKLLGALALGAINPAAALLPLIDPGTHDAGDPCAETAAPAPVKPKAATQRAPATPSSAATKR